MERREERREGGKGRKGANLWPKENSLMIRKSNGTTSPLAENERGKSRWQRIYVTKRQWEQ